MVGRDRQHESGSLPAPIRLAGYNPQQPKDLDRWKQCFCPTSLQIPEDAELVKPRRKVRELPELSEAAMGLDHVLLRLRICFFTSLVQEGSAMGDEPRRILEQRAVARVGIDDELRVLRRFEHVVGVNARKHGIVAAVHDERRLPDGA